MSQILESGGSSHAQNVEVISQAKLITRKSTNLKHEEEETQSGKKNVAMCHGILPTTIP